MIDRIFQHLQSVQFPTIESPVHLFPSQTNVHLSLDCLQPTVALFSFLSNQDVIDTTGSAQPNTVYKTIDINFSNLFLHVP